VARSVRGIVSAGFRDIRDEIGVAPVGGVGEGDEPHCIYAAAEATAGEPFSPPPALPRKTIGRRRGRGGVEGRPAVVEVRSIGQMMNDESENIRLTDHRVSVGHTAQ